MKLSIRLQILLMLMVATPVYAAIQFDSTSSQPPSDVRQQLLSSYGKLPLSFEANTGQSDPAVQFLSRGAGYILYLTHTDAILTLTKASEAPKDPREKVTNKTETATLKMRLIGAAPHPKITGEERLPGKVNYLIGQDPARWTKGVTTYEKVHYENVYPGIDLVYYGNQRQLEYDFVVAPGADPKKIGLRFEGSDKLQINSEGDLILKVGSEEVRLHRPLVYQEKSGVREVIPARYVQKGKNRIGFQVAAYDQSKALIIDPILSYSTFLGGSGRNQGNGIAVDASGYVYLTGTSESNDFRTTPGAYDRTFNGGCCDAFVSKLDPTGSTVLYSTYLGGNESDGATGIAVDAAGNAYVTGWTRSANFPTTPGAFSNSTVVGSIKPFVTKLNAAGSDLLYSTFLARNSTNGSAHGIAIDASGNAYIVGETPSFDFPTTPGAFNTTAKGDFVTKLNSTGSALLYSTFLGVYCNISGIAVDGGGNAYLTGYTGHADFPTTPGAYQTSYQGGFYDVFVTKLNASGSSLLYSTFLGGSGNDFGTAIAVDASGQVYITGQTSSVGFPTTPGAYQTTFQGGSTNNDAAPDGFVAKINVNGSSLVYSTFLGGKDPEVATAIAVNSSGEAYVTGYTGSADFPTTPGALDTTINGVYDIFLTKLNAAGSALLYATFLGGSGSEDASFAIAINASEQIYLSGITGSTDFPTTPGAFDTVNGHNDGFFSVLNLGLTDVFNRPNGTQLGVNWNEYQPDFEIFNQQLRNVTAGNESATYKRAFGPDQSVSVDCKVMAPGNSCGVMARLTDGNNFYRARIDVGQGNVALYKTVNGVTNSLGAATRPLQIDTYYHLRLVVEGAVLSVFLNHESNPLISVTDGSLRTGDLTGIRSFSTSPGAVWFDNFDVVTPYSDPFSRANSSNLGLDWNEYLSGLEIFSNQLRNTNAGNKAAVFNQILGPDQDITVQCKVTAPDTACGLMARWSDAGNFYRLRLDAGLQNIALFKTVNGVTTRIGVASQPLQLNTYYRLRLVVQGTGLAVFFQDESAPLFTAVDASLPKGDFSGIRASASGPATTWFDNFTARRVEAPFTPVSTSVPGR
ncbi:MAG: SBBP repeat-containing protein [Nitrospirae bacterium]|nr:SBBP repeat-containing protein [Candidatus Manganitrophaceae bacterium]